MQEEEIKRMIAGAVHCANRVLLAFKRANKDVYQLKERVKLVCEFDKLCDDIFKTVKI